MEYGPQTFLDIAVGDTGHDDVWAVGTDNKLYRRGGTSSTVPAGDRWEHPSNTAENYIDVASGND